MARISKIVSDAMNEIAEECEMPLSADDKSGAFIGGLAGVMAGSVAGLVLGGLTGAVGGRDGGLSRGVGRWSRGGDTRWNRRCHG